MPQRLLEDGLAKNEKKFSETSRLGGAEAVAHHWELLAVVASATVAAAAVAAVRRRAAPAVEDEGSFLWVSLDALDTEGPREEEIELAREA